MSIYALIDGYVAVRVSYDDRAKRWLARSGHYLDNPQPGALFALTVQRSSRGLFGTVGDGTTRGMCVVGRPIARQLPQDGTYGEIVRFVLESGLPHGIASELLRATADHARNRRKPIRVLIAYHDRTRHTGCIYRKAGFRKDGVTKPHEAGWSSRPNRKSANYERTSKRRWRLDL